MSQNKSESLVEVFLNGIIVFLTSLTIQIIIFSLFDIHVSIITSVILVIIFTVISIFKNIFNSQIL